ncbi:GTP 3',8-cyclase MoaA [Paenibacillus sp. GCM10023248]|uniref:GTP 3',8-cyclase MoaA n=1 Tax=Bacillales TaxID=1385 RepID=UPI0023782346|nr:MULTISPECIES: GTP 3',8-cyclase MoaA [Bacillales]MDD9267082.1 GTP 3',8-cyclase MoaA [Paenibacillus sp. MAHUQ-63]MDR6881297.1 cyclic pyranopterin phosphate synthase [Bacillus sp. 3255]
MNNSDKQAPQMTDTLHRPLRDLRISVTDRCNFRCRYCMPEEVFGPNFQFLPQEKLLSLQELERLTRIFVSLGVEKIRITGGEPLLNKNIADIISRVRHIEGVKDIAVTTNGSLLKHKAKELREAGLERITVSLDSLDDERFGVMNGRGYSAKSVLEGIDAAASAGLSVKVNMVVQKGVNDQDIVPMAKYFREHGHILRFIEFMDVGNTNGWNLQRVVPSQQIIEIIHKVMPLEPIESNYVGEVATRYRYQGSQDEIGFISSVTQAFCSTCTRARLSAEGHLYTCLFASDKTDLLSVIREGASDDAVRSLIAQVWRTRQDRYSETRLEQTFPKPKVEMSHIGG